MKIKVGNKFAKIVNESGYTKKHIAEKLGISSQWLIKLLEKKELEAEFIAKVGDVIKHDFKKDFKSLNVPTKMTPDLEAKIEKLIEVNTKLLDLMVKMIDKKVLV